MPYNQGNFNKESLMKSLVLSLLFLSSFAQAQDTQWNSSKGVLTLTDAGATLAKDIEASVALGSFGSMAVYQKNGAYAIVGACAESVKLTPEGFPYEAVFRLELPKFVAVATKAPKNATQVRLQIAVIDKGAEQFSQSLAAAYFVDENGADLSRSFEGPASRREVTNSNLVKSLKAIASSGDYCR
jgi:hypothetical protein